MKKTIYTLFISFILCICSMSVSAATTKYQPNVFTDETTIEEDFKNLGIDINDYYKPKNYDYEKWYVIAMSEGYVNTDTFDIQTYFYLYNPSEYGAKDNYMSTVSSVYLTYKIGEHGQEIKNAASTKLDYNQEHLIYKVKGFTYSFSERSEIYITQIQHYNLYGLGITSDSGFRAVANHSKLKGFQVELAFDSTLIIEEKEAVIVNIAEENPYYSTWNSFWNYFWSSWKNEYKLLFYNFNFPKDIKPDSIEYAKFQYTKEVEYKKYRQALLQSPGLKDSKLESSRDVHEYLPGTFKIQVNSASKELDFPTFYLGDRIKDHQFGYLEFEEEDKKKFNYQASILLDCLTDGKCFGTNKDDLTGWYLTDNDYIERYESVSNIEFLELHYKKDGILYKCQIVSQPVDPTTVRPTVRKSWWDKFLEFLVKMFDFIFFDKLKYSFWLPDVAKQIFSGIILFVAVFYVIPFIFKKVIKGLRILFRRE